MRRFATAFATIILAAYSLSVYAAWSSIVLNTKEKVFVISEKDCKEKGICDLKKVSFVAEQIRLPPEFVGDIDLLQTTFLAAYETTQVVALEKYAFVQFVRGCAFWSYIDENGEVKETLRIFQKRWRDNAPRRSPFHFSDWTIDSWEADPVYSSAPSMYTTASQLGFRPSRHMFYMWQKGKGDLELYADPEEEGIAQKAFYYGKQEKPRFPRLYVQDQPSAAVVESDKAKARNYSLQFRTCLYKTAEVPAAVESRDINFAEPIVCFEWDHNFVFDHQAKIFVAKKEISPICARPPEADDYAIGKISQ